MRSAVSTNPDFVGLGDTLGDANDKRNLGLDSLNDGVGGKGGRHVDDGRVGGDLVHGLRESPSAPAPGSASPNPPARTSRTVPKTG